MTLRRFALAAASCALAATAITAQDPSFDSALPGLAQGQRPPRPPVFRTEANLVRVDVHVLKNGGPVADLKEDDFEVLEDGFRQKISSLEFIRVDLPQSGIPVAPSSTRAAFELAADPRNRVFVVFLDTYHVLEENSLQTSMPMVQMLDSMIGPTDLIGLMMPQMEFRDLILGRDTAVLRQGLLETRRWGRKVRHCNDVGNLDEVEKVYTVCFPPPKPPPPCEIGPLAMELILRRREAYTFGVLTDLVRSIGARREARTHIVTLSEGWRLARPNDGMSGIGAASPPQIRIGPGGGLGTQNPANYNVDQEICMRHLRDLAQRDNQQAYRDLIDEANRNNASFYVVDVAGLRAQDPRSPIRRPGDLGMRHSETLASLAENTNGSAIIHTNDLKGALLRVVDELTGYYLLRYYSTNTKSDGTFRSIRVKVNRPGVEVRARKGYRAWTANDVKAMNEARAKADAPIDPDAAAHGAALSRLSRLKPDTQLYLHATIDSARSELHVVGELSSIAAKSPAWRQGGEAQILVSAPDGSPAGMGRATIAAGGRFFLARLPLSGSAPGAYEIAVRLRLSGGAALLERVQAMRSPEAIGEPIAFRSGPQQNQQPVAMFLWWRTESIRFEAPLGADAAPPTGRLLDRAGNVMPVPVDVTIRDDAGSRWAVVTFKLAPLSPGDYILELVSGPARRFVALRVDR